MHMSFILSPWVWLYESDKVVSLTYSIFLDTKTTVVKREANGIYSSFDKMILWESYQATIRWNYTQVFCLYKNN